jgi:hypothetical protein
LVTLVGVRLEVETTVELLEELFKRVAALATAAITARSAGKRGHVRTLELTHRKW